MATTLGTGIGTALIFNGELIPNTELGHLELLKGKGDAEKYAASSIREKLDMGYKKWAKRLTKYYSLMEFYLDPQLFVVGGGVSRVSEKFLPYIAYMSGRSSGASACLVGLESLSLPSVMPLVLASASALAMGLGSLISTLEEKRMVSTILLGLRKSLRQARWYAFASQMLTV